MLFVKPDITKKVVDEAQKNTKRRAKKKRGAAPETTILADDARGRECLASPILQFRLVLWCPYAENSRFFGDDGLKM